MDSILLSEDPQTPLKNIYWKRGLKIGFIIALIWSALSITGSYVLFLTPYYWPAIFIQDVSGIPMVASSSGGFISLPVPTLIGLIIFAVLLIILGLFFGFLIDLIKRSSTKKLGLAILFITGFAFTTLLYTWMTASGNLACSLRSDTGDHSDLGTRQSRCYLNLAKTEKNPSICNKVRNSDLHNSCTLTYFSSNSVQDCDVTFPTDYWKGKCYKRVLYNSRAEPDQLCNSLVETNSRDKCQMALMNRVTIEDPNVPIRLVFWHDEHFQFYYDAARYSVSYGHPMYLSSGDTVKSITLNYVNHPTVTYADIFLGNAGDVETLLKIKNPIKETLGEREYYVIRHNYSSIVDKETVLSIDCSVAQCDQSEGDAQRLHDLIISLKFR